MPDAALQLGEAIQTAHINHHPSPAHDLNPSTAASSKQPVRLASDTDALSTTSFADADADSNAPSSSSSASDERIPLSALRPVPRRANFGPLPDFRFEQSYLASIDAASTWQAVAYITIKDQVLLPLVQGVGWNLIVVGYQHFSKGWNVASRFSGQSVGARLRRWWWGVNNWKIPEAKKSGLDLGDRKLAEEVKENSAVVEAIEGGHP